MNEPSSEPQHSGLINLEVIGVEEESCQLALNKALEILEEKLPPGIKHLVAGTSVIIGDGLINGGGLTVAEDRKITLDASKNRLSLESAERFLVSNGFLDVGDWTITLPELKEQPWSCLTYQLVHELGHLIDGLSEGKTYDRLSTVLSPTKYGKTSPGEAFAEAFAYWAFGLELEDDASRVVTKVLSL